MAIIGGGAAGLMVAAGLVERGEGFEIDLFERNKGLGAKVIISGGGRCNVTTGIFKKKELLKRYTRGGDFLKKAMGKFPPPKVMEFFEKNGVKLKIEDDLRVFPVSDDGKDVVKVFERIFRRSGVNLRLNEVVEDVGPVDEKSVKVVTAKGEFVYDYVVLTTGGNAYSHTGSKGDGYKFAGNFGHTVTKLGPSLNSFLCQEDWPKELSGISLPNAGLSALAEDGEMKSVDGPLLFTHFGISGPAVFALSSHLAFTKISVHHPMEIGIAAIAGKSFQKWDAEMIEYFQRNGSKAVLSFLKEYFPMRFVGAVLGLAGIDGGCKCAELSKEKRVELANLLAGDLNGGGLRVTTVQRRPGDEFVTAGGVKLSEVDPKTMQSRKHDRLFFGGEILDVDGVTGGFNLQASWATGMLAGANIGK